MDISDEILMAFADNELPQAQAAQVAARVAADTALSERLDRFRRVRAVVAKLADQTPPFGRDVLQAARDAVARRNSQNRRAWSIAMAASVAGVAIGLGIASLEPLVTPGVQDREMKATGILAAALDATPSGDQRRARGDWASPLYTVVAADGTTCRGFRGLETDLTYEGLACREGDRWRIKVLAQTTPTTASYAQVSSDESLAVAAAVDSLRPGDPLGRDAETARIRAGWVESVEKK